MTHLRTIGLALLLATAGGCFKANINLGGNGDAPSKTSTDRPSQTPSGPGGSWRDVLSGVATEVLLGSEYDAIFYAFDTLAYPGEPVQLAVRLQRAGDLSAIRDAKVGFLLNDRLIGVASPDKDGYASIAWTPPEAGDTEFVCRIIEAPRDYQDLLKVTPATLLVAAREKDAPIVVIDLDHTVVASSFFYVLLRGAQPMPDSRRVTERIAETYTLVYLTHRPDVLSRKSKAWLRDNGYPPGPLLVSEIKDAFGDSGKFKTARLAAIAKSYPNVRVGIGDKMSDAQAYVDNDLIAYLIPYYKQKPKDMRKAADEIAHLKGRGRLQVVNNWQELEAGFFEGRTFSPDSYVTWLRREADRIEAEERARKQHNDDDD